MIRTVLGNIGDEELGVTLAHEHIACYYEPFYQIMGSAYLDKAALRRRCAEVLRELKEKHGLASYIDCTPINIGRDLDLIRDIARESGVNIVTATGFYHTEEVVLKRTSEHMIYEALKQDALASNAGLLKFGLEADEPSPFLERVLNALCRLQKELGLPLFLHTHWENRNAKPLLEKVLALGVPASSVVVCHLDDTEDADFITEVAKSGCYIGFDRIDPSDDPAYINKTAGLIFELWNRGFGEKLLLSHDEPMYNAFQPQQGIQQRNPYLMLFDRILPALQELGLSHADVMKLVTENPKNALLCR